MLRIIRDLRLERTRRGPASVRRRIHGFASLSGRVTMEAL